MTSSNSNLALQGRWLPMNPTLALFWLVFYIFLQNLEPCDSQFIDIQTELGRIRGSQLRTHYNNPGIAFLGIPYAMPPVGERRFKKPIAAPKWAPKTLVATRYQSCCPQLDINGVPHGHEDCLYLNVFVPLHHADQNQFAIGGKRFPVMIYIQGESFENGDAALYGPEYLLDWDVVLVTFNYRLGALGFFSTGDEHAPGNWGLYDQLLVLRWVQDHIESFSGNPTLVTLFGQGAGAASAVLHLVSPLSTGLFHRVIAQSGSPLCSWSLESNPEQVAHELARRVGCSTNLGHAELVRCMRHVPIANVLRAQQQGKIFGEYPHQLVPVVELAGSMSDRLVPDEPRVLLSQGNYRHVPLLMGYNRDETAYFYPLILHKQFIGDTAHLRSYLEGKLLPRFIRATILDRNIFVDPSSSSITKLKTNQKELERDLLQNILFKYFNFMNSKNYTDMAARFVNMSTDALYGACIDETLRLYAAASATGPIDPYRHDPKVNLWLPFANITYKYVFDYRGRNSMLGLILSGSQQRNQYARHYDFPLTQNPELSHLVNSAVCHGDELFYLFNLQFTSRKPDDNRDVMTQKRLLSLWTDFAKHGFSPSTASLEIPYWPSYTSSKPVVYHISDKLAVLEGYRDSASHFWIRYLPSITSSSSSALASIIQKPNSNSGQSWAQTGSGHYHHYYDAHSVSRLRTFAWSMLAVSLILLVLVAVLIALLYYQRRRQTFSAQTSYRVRDTSAKTLAKALAASRRASSSTSGLY